VAESTSRIRVIRAYRSWREGDVLDATPQLARRLIALGVAREETGPRPGRQAATERAVAPMTGEVR
jgi:hypothetical protein